MPRKENLNRESTRAIWQESYETWMSQPEAERLATEPAVHALVAALRGCRNWEELSESYYRPGDWPSPFLLRQLPDDPGLDRLLTLEEAAFWLRYLELTEQDR